MASEGFHEPIEKLPPDVIDRHRAIVSIMEELEAVDWYDQRIACTDDQELAAVLAHNRDEEKEHAAMAIEWLRRNDPTFDAELRTYLFTTAPITAVEEQAIAGNGVADESSGSDEGKRSRSGGNSLGIGSLRISIEESQS